MARVRRRNLGALGRPGVCSCPEFVIHSPGSNGIGICPVPLRFRFGLLLREVLFSSTRMTINATHLQSGLPERTR